MIRFSRALSVSARSCAEISVDNPFSGLEYCKVPLMSDEESLAKLRKAEETQKMWATTSLKTRQQLCEEVLKQFEASKEEIGKDITGMMGKPLRQAVGEMGGLVERATAMIDLSEA